MNSKYLGKLFSGLLILILGWVSAGYAIAQETTLPAAEMTTQTLPFHGVRHIHRFQTQPRLLNIYLVEVDLTDPAIHFTVTKPNGPDVPGETTVQTTREFVEQTGVQIAINTSFYSIDTSPYVDNLGLGSVDGEIFSPMQTGFPALNIDCQGYASILDDTDTTTAIYHAVAGNERIIRDGVITAGDTSIHPRTAVGITENQKLLILVVDGRNEKHSLGMTTPEVAQVLFEYGAMNAINLDGGGSSTLVFADPTPRVVNIPVGMKLPGSERSVGMNLGIYAAPAQEEKEAMK